MAWNRRRSGVLAVLFAWCLIVGASGIVIERLFLSRLYHLDHLYGLLLTFGLALIIEGVFRKNFGSSGLGASIRGAHAAERRSLVRVEAVAEDQQFRGAAHECGRPSDWFS